jgi:hypothetical protein
VTKTERSARYRDNGILSVPHGGSFVVEPESAFGQVPEAQRGTCRHGDHRAPDAVTPLPQWVCVGIPAIEIADHRHSSRGLGRRQHERDANLAAGRGLGYLDQVSAPLQKSCLPGGPSGTSPGYTRIRMEQSCVAGMSGVQRLSERRPGWRLPGAAECGAEDSPSVPSRYRPSAARAERVPGIQLRLGEPETYGACRSERNALLQTVSFAIMKCNQPSPVS